MVRLRFAPSPTGYLHIGGARTALFNWLQARKEKGTFILRVEDTDQERSTPQSKQAIFDSLRWLGIDWDEGPLTGGPFGPYEQMQRLHLYRKYAEELVAQGFAYRCTCSKQELDAQREKAASLKRPWKYPGTCRGQREAGGKPYVIRFRVPEQQTVAFDDLVCGHIQKDTSDLYDEVLCRFDYVPLYNFGCVVDDHEMAITLVGRGQEHINSTFGQLLLYRAFGWEPPRFAHFPLILGANREKLSKRLHPDADVMNHQRNGILPEALLNYIVRLGWSHGNDEVISREQMISWFDFSQVGSTSGVWNPEKLLWLNQQWLRKLDAADVLLRVRPFLADRGLPIDDPRIPQIVALLLERSRTLVELAEGARVFFQEISIDPEAAARQLNVETKPLLQRARAEIASLPEPTAPLLEERFRAVAAELKLGLGKIAQPVRVAVTGSTVSPPLFDILVLLGRDEALRRIDRAMETIR